MVMRFDHATRSSLIERYGEAVQRSDLNLPTGDALSRLVVAANIAHIGFFVYWHSYVVKSLDGNVAVLGPVIAERVDQIGQYAD